MTKMMEYDGVEGDLSGKESLPDLADDPAVLEKVSWANEMRLHFSPKGMCRDDGTINQDFFKPKRIIIQLTEARKWGETEKIALLKVRCAVHSCIFRERLLIQLLCYL